MGQLDTKQQSTGDVISLLGNYSGLKSTRRRAICSGQLPGLLTPPRVEWHHHSPADPGAEGPLAPCALGSTEAAARLPVHDTHGIVLTSQCTQELLAWQAKASRLAKQDRSMNSGATALSRSIQNDVDQDLSDFKLREPRSRGAYTACHI
jgi:hypothetical protein